MAAQGSEGAFLWLHMHARPQKVFFTGTYGVIYKGKTTNITTCPNYPRCNFNCERFYTSIINNFRKLTDLGFAYDFQP